MNGIDIALMLLEIVFKIAPELATLFQELTSGSTNPLAQRVKDIMPEESESRKAQHNLGG